MIVGLNVQVCVGQSVAGSIRSRGTTVNMYGGRFRKRKPLDQGFFIWPQSRFYVSRASSLRKVSIFSFNPIRLLLFSDGFGGAQAGKNPHVGR